MSDYYPAIIVGGVLLDDPATIRSAIGLSTGTAEGNVVTRSAGGAISNPGAGDSSERFGLGSLAAGTATLALGFNASAPGNFSMAIGSGTVVSGTESIGMGSAVGFNFCVGIGTSQTHRGQSAVLIGRSASGFAAGNTGYVGIGFAATAAGSAVAIGNSALARAGSSIAIGTNAAVDATETNAVVIGSGASTNAGQGGGQQVAIGSSASAAWRGVAIGHLAFTSMVSGTAIGWGASSAAPHGVAIGRGAWVATNNDIAIGFNGGNGTIRVHPGSLHTHKFVTTYDASVVDLTPTLNRVVYAGPDAFDATASPTNDVAGGPTQVSGGRSTGTAIGGPVEIATTPAGGSSNNTKNAEIVAARFDATAGVDSRFLLLDLTDGTLKRISFGADDSAGSGFKVLRVAN